MKQILVMMAVMVMVGCGTTKVITDPVVEKEVRNKVKIYEGELTELDLAKVTVIYGFGKNSQQITDAGLKELTKLPKLRTLDLGKTQITDAGLKEVIKLQNLESLGIDNTKITGAGLKELTKLENLWSLNALNTKIVGAHATDFRKASPKLKDFTYSYDPN